MKANYSFFTPSLFTGAKPTKISRSATSDGEGINVDGSGR